LFGIAFCPVIGATAASRLNATNATAYCLFFGNRLQDSCAQPCPHFVMALPDGVLSLLAVATAVLSLAWMDGYDG